MCKACSQAEADRLFASINTKRVLSPKCKGRKCKLQNDSGKAGWPWLCWWLFRVSIKGTIWERSSWYPGFHRNEHFCSVKHTVKGGDKPQTGRKYLQKTSPYLRNDLPRIYQNSYNIAIRSEQPGFKNGQRAESDTSAREDINGR